MAKYAESGFEAVWFASAFKGTTGPAQAWPPLNHHVRNQLSWLRVMQAVPRFAPLRFQGIVLTGWQRWAPWRASQPRCPAAAHEVTARLSLPRRYDHYSVLCELLPVGIPSLAVCLQTLVHGERGRAPRPHPSHPTASLEPPWLPGRGQQGFAPLVWCGVTWVPLLVLPRGLHGRDAEEGPGRAGLPEHAAGAGDVVRGCGTEPGACCSPGVHRGDQGLLPPALQGAGAHHPAWSCGWCCATCWALTSPPRSPHSEGRGAFPGVEIYRMVEQVNGHLKESIQKALEEER